MLELAAGRLYGEAFRQEVVARIAVGDVLDLAGPTEASYLRLEDDAHAGLGGGGRLVERCGCAADEEVEADEHDGKIVELYENGDKIRDEVDRKEEVRADSHEDELLLRGDPAIADERPDQTDVGREAADEIEDLRHVLRRSDPVSQYGPPPAGSVPEARAGPAPVPRRDSLPST